MSDKVFNILGSIVILATITTLILPGRQTVGVINSLSNGFTGSLKTAMGGN